MKSVILLAAMFVLSSNVFAGFFGKRSPVLICKGTTPTNRGLFAVVETDLQKFIHFYYVDASTNEKARGYFDRVLEAKIEKAAVDGYNVFTAKESELVSLPFYRYLNEYRVDILLKGQNLKNARLNLSTYEGERPEEKFSYVVNCQFVM